MSTTLKSIPVTITKDGDVQLLEPLKLRGPTNALLTFALEEEDVEMPEPALLSEGALSDWNSEEEDKAWAHLEEAI